MRILCTYKCHRGNRYGRKQNGYAVIVVPFNFRDKPLSIFAFYFLGKPDRPEGPLEVTGVTKNGCKLKWSKPKDDGGAPIEYYEIEKLDPLTRQWIPCGKSSEPEANITGLQEGKQYKFRVRAVNKEGESDDLEADKFIVAKNPFGNISIFRL